MCGGSHWQHLKYVEQLQFKQKEVQKNLLRIGGLDLPPVSPIIGSAKTYHYRNKLEFTFSNAQWLSAEKIRRGQPIPNREALGFHLPQRWNKTFDLEDFYLQATPSKEIRLTIEEYVIKQEWLFYDLKRQEGFLLTLLIQVSYTGEVMVLIQFFSDDEAKRRALFEFLQERFPKKKYLLDAINNKGNASIYDIQVQYFYGRLFIYEEREGLRFKVDAKSFFQIHSEQAYVFYKVTRNFASLLETESIYDLYTGIGTIAQFISAQTHKVISFEPFLEAIALAEENARLNSSIDNCIFFCGDIKTLFTTDFVEEQGKPKVVIADPTRQGMHEKVIETLLKIEPQRIVYVSCNSATQARNIALIEKHYTLSRVQPIDIFPQTRHVENVLL